jgi:hypothetical protein
VAGLGGGTVAARAGGARGGAGRQVKGGEGQARPRWRTWVSLGKMPSNQAWQLASFSRWLSLIRPMVLDSSWVAGWGGGRPWGDRAATHGGKALDRACACVAAWQWSTAGGEGSYGPLWACGAVSWACCGACGVMCRAPQRASDKFGNGFVAQCRPCGRRQKPSVQAKVFSSLAGRGNQGGGAACGLVKCRAAKDEEQQVCATRRACTS